MKSIVDLIPMVLAEFLGTFMLVFTFSSDTTNGTPLGPISVGGALMVMVYALGSVSGANFNPAVTLALLVVGLAGHGDMDCAQALIYWPVQLFAGLCGAFSSALVFAADNSGEGLSRKASNATEARLLEEKWENSAGAFGPGAGFDIGNAFFAELVFTCMLCFVVLNVATCGDEKPDKKNFYFGLAIGGVIFAAANAIGAISGCCLNPAVSFGAAMAAASLRTPNVNDVMGYLALYWLAQTIAALLAVFLFMLCRHWMFGKKQDKKEDPDDDPSEPSLFAKIVAEFIGTFYLCLTVVLCLNQVRPPQLRAVGITFALVVMVYALGAVSGANFNPAVSLGLLLTCNLPIISFLFYVITQILGALFAMCVGRALLGEVRAFFVREDVPEGGPVIANGTVSAIAGSEIVYTFLLVFVVLNVAVADSKNQYYGLAIGWVLLVGGAAIGGISGGVFNPAIALALDAAAIFNDQDYDVVYGWGWLYCVFEFIGAIIAVAMFLAVRQCRHDGKKDDKDSAEEASDYEGFSEEASD